MGIKYIRRKQSNPDFMMKHISNIHAEPKSIIDEARYEAIVMGASAGGIKALSYLFYHLPEDFPIPIFVVIHLHPGGDSSLADSFRSKCSLTVREASDKESIQAGHIYFAPPDYHLLIEADRTLSLSIDEKVNYARPSIDVLFESAVDVWFAGLIGIILTGANMDGAQGIRQIKKNRGLTIAQDPASAEYPAMPQAAIDTGCIDRILHLKGIGEFLGTL